MIERIVFKLTLRYIRRFDVDDLVALKILLRQFNAKKKKWITPSLSDVMSKVIAARSEQIAANVTANNGVLTRLQQRSENFLREQAARDAE